MIRGSGEKRRRTALGWGSVLAAFVCVCLCRDLHAQVASGKTYHSETQVSPGVVLPETEALRAFLVPSPSTGTGSSSPVEPTHDHTAIQNYRLPFGKNPYSPSEAKASFEGFLQPAEIPTASYCAHCHGSVHADWRQSAHANSFRTPWYVKNVGELSRDQGVEATRHCEGCHNPAALFTGALTTGSTVARPHDEDGVTCMVCHSIQAVQSTRGTGSYVMGKPAVLVDAHGQAVAGVPSDAEILAHLDRHKQAVMRPLYKTSEFCAACHKAAIPSSLNQYKWLRTFTTWDEWQQSSWSTETPLPFYSKPAASTCQSCHMAREGSTDAASPMHLAASHRWLGANTAIPTLYGYNEQLQRIEPTSSRSHSSRSRGSTPRSRLARRRSGPATWWRRWTAVLWRCCRETPSAWMWWCATRASGTPWCRSCGTSTKAGSTLKPWTMRGRRFTGRARSTTPAMWTPKRGAIPPRS